ncbi:hypothetical protein [Nitrosococcus watsonii]|uniref:Cytochrome c domain-containing protein n=1 Tax=Nitrosococcus watsoni (strain C-113) TaxID=105559 RepID=D8K5Q7_NITWC|nr:hypothetical protein [Nitrosococcus watsonii]ADJ28234.1 conserved hypothetical protein [Nitrosococcus watsonii C-113]
MKKINTVLLCPIAILAVMVSGCDSQPEPGESASQESSYPEPFEYRFAGYDKECAGIPGYLDPYHYGYDLTAEEKRGACTWYLWAGGDPMGENPSQSNAGGNPHFWREAEARTWKIAKVSGLQVNLNFLAFLDSRVRDERFEKFGVINDPGCQKASKPDAYGLWLDECQDPYSSGVMGLRVFPNQNFDPEKWDVQKYLEEDATIEPPYLTGLTCGICHIAFNPVNPPKDPEHPEWENFAGAFGNQYIKEGALFGQGLKKEDFLYWVYAKQPAGTSDTSRISMDFIDNPNAINSIFYITSARPTYEEVMNDGTTRKVPHILKDGADSIGAGGAALRVYVNIGTCGDYRMSIDDTFLGIKPQHPFDLAKAEAECEDWRLTAARMDDAAAFLNSPPPFKLQDAPGGEQYLTKDEEQLSLGKKVFAQYCARCHSSKLPEGYSHEGMEKHADAAKDDWVKLVMSDDFLERNFLSDDRRYPLYSDDPSIAIGTNAARAVASNATEGHVWQNFSSKTYKELPSVGKVALYNPFNADKPIQYEFPAGGRGYYRTPSLISVWATAPFLHNNMLGIYNHDPSVKGRVEAFMDAAEKLLWPEKRLGPDSIKVTPMDTYLRFRSLEVRVPAGTPIKLLANISLDKVADKKELLKDLKESLKDPTHLVKLVKALKGQEQFDDELKKLVPKLLRYNQIPDFVEDKGHNTHICRDPSDEKITCLSDEEKRALIEYLKFL